MFSNAVGLASVQNYVLRCLRTGIRLEDMNSSRRDSTTAMTTPLFQTQPPEPQACRRDVPCSRQETAASVSQAAGKVSASSSATSNISSTDRQAVDDGRRPSSFTSTPDGKQISTN